MDRFFSPDLFIVFDMKGVVIWTLGNIRFGGIKKDWVSSLNTYFYGFYVEI